MTRLLVSVRNAAEARHALLAGADLIDVKEPARGSLGAADSAQLAEVLSAVAGQLPVSVALGELLDFPFTATAESFDPLLDCRYAKLGLAGCADLPDWPALWHRALAALPPGIERVAVAYADWQTARAPDPWQVLRHGIGLDCAALLVDTHDKSRGSLPALYPQAALVELMEGAWSAGMIVVLAGSLTFANLDEVLALQPDYLAVRGGVCRGDRAGVLDADLVRQWSDLLKCHAGSS